MTQPKPGDVVELKSGGPRMTVDRVDPDGMLWCRWFVDGTLRSGAFTTKQLEQTTA